VLIRTMIILVVIMLHSNVLAKLPHITVVTENSAIQYMKDGKVLGPTTELIRAMLTNTGFTHDITIYPWARAYAIAQKQPNVLIYSMVRTPEREPLFKWGRELLNADLQVYRLKTRVDVTPKSQSDMRNYTMGVVRSSIVHKTLQDKGFTNLHIVSKIEINLKQLVSGKLDLFVHRSGYFEALCQRNGIDPDLFEAVLPFNYINNGLYFAFSKQTSDDVVRSANAAFDELKKQGLPQKLLPSRSEK